MKKSLIALGVLVIALLALPIIGNSVIQKNIDERVAELQNYGISTVKTEHKNNYLQTKTHFEFLLKDAGAFVSYLNNFADNQIPSYANALFEGMLIGVDLEYSNIAFMNALSIDIYPMRLSKTMEESLVKENPQFFAYIEKFLDARGILYHINYDIATQKFDGYAKDIDEKQMLDAQTQLQFILKAFSFDGEGDMAAPQKLITSLEKIELNLKNDQESFLFALEDLKTLSSADSKTDYSSELSFKKFDFTADAQENNLAFRVKNGVIKASSQTKESNIGIDSHSFMEEIVLLSKELDFNLSETRLDMNLGELEAVSYEALLEMVSRMNQSDAMMDPALIVEMQSSLSELFSKGLLFEIGEFSIKNIELQKGNMLGGFDLKSTTKLLADSNFAQKLKLSPLLLVPNIETNAKIKLSKKLYEISLSGDARELVSSYLKEDGDAYIFDISFKDSQVKINNRPLL